MRRRALPTTGFTLVEILIVVAILGILAAIVISSFSDATTDTQISATTNELQKLRRHIGVYQARNNYALPAVLAGEGTWGEIIGRDYLLAPPVNAWVGGLNSRKIVFGAGPDGAYQSDYGWIYDPVSGQVYAGSFDANDQPLPR